MSPSVASVSIGMSQPIDTVLLYFYFITHAMPRIHISETNHSLGVFEGSVSDLLYEESLTSTVVVNRIFMRQSGCRPCPRREDTPFSPCPHLHDYGRIRNGSCCRMKGFARHPPTRALSVAEGLEIAARD